MNTIAVHQEKTADPVMLCRLCPFGAIVPEGDGVRITDSCRMCLLCVRKGPAGVFELLRTDDEKETVDISRWRGVLVSVEHQGGHVHPVSLELIGKARSLAGKIGHPVFASVAGSGVDEVVEEVLCHGVDVVCVHDDPLLSSFLLEPRASALEDAIVAMKPSVVLVGGTVNGRALAPRTAARFRTGLTADCTALDIRPNGDLDQIRPAFGGNIMAHIRTPGHRPQFATVRYKIFDMAGVADNPGATVIRRTLSAERLASGAQILDSREKGTGRYIEDMDVLVAVGRGIGRRENLRSAQHLAGMLGGMVACTRPLVENGWMDPRCQIGLSGRTVRPKLIICCGISGSVQFTAGMNGAERIVAINTDRNAPLFRTAHLSLVGDVMPIIGKLIDRIEKGA